MSDVSASIGSGKNFLANACSLSYRLLSFTVSVSCLSLRLVTTSCGSYRGSLGRPAFLRAHFAMRYVPFGVLWLSAFVLYVSLCCCFRIVALLFLLFSL